MFLCNRILGHSMSKLIITSWFLRSRLNTFRKITSDCNYLIKWPFALQLNNKLQINNHFTIKVYLILYQCIVRILYTFQTALILLSIVSINIVLSQCIGFVIGKTSSRSLCCGLLQCALMYQVFTYKIFNYKSVWFIFIFYY